jgi:hypothetical protein
MFSSDTGEKNGSTVRVHQLFIDIKKVCDLGRRDILQYSHRVRVPMKLVRLIKMCLNEMYSKVCVGKH